MDLEIIILSGGSQTKINDITFITYNHLHVKSKKMIQMNLFIKQKQTHRHRKQTYINSYQRGKERGWIN